MKTNNVVRRSYKMAPSYGEEEDNEKLGRSDEELTRIGRYGPYAVLDFCRIKIYEIARASTEIVRRSSNSSFPSVLVKMF